MKYKKITLGILLLCTILIGYKYIKFLGAKIEYTNDNFKIDSLVKAHLNEKELALSSITKFDWDEMYIFDPYYPDDGIQEDVGTHWTRDQSFLWYLLTGYNSGIINDGYKKAVFLKDKQVVCDVNYNTNLFDFDAFYYKREEAVFIISKEFMDKYGTYYLKKK